MGEKISTARSLGGVSTYILGALLQAAWDKYCKHHSIPVTRCLQYVLKLLETTIYILPGGYAKSMKLSHRRRASVSV